MKTIHVLLFASATAVAGWFAAKDDWLSFFHPAKSAAQPGERKILYYQSAMHPWIKSDKPGKCTICGMNLAPVFVGDKGFATGPGTLGIEA